MDFVKREDNNLMDEESYKAYTEVLQKQHQMEPHEYQHTAISMEQLHQAMQSSLTSNTLHNFQLPLSPRQMSTLMLKSNHLTRNLHLSDIPRNLTSEIEMAQNLVTDVNVGQMNGVLGRHEEVLIQNLTRTMNENTMRSLANEIDLHQNIGLAQNLVQSITEQMDLTRNLELNQNLTQNLVRSDGANLTQHMIHSDGLNQNVTHELDLSHHVNRTNIDQEILEEARRTPIVQCEPDTMLEQNLGPRLAGHALPIQDTPRQTLEQNEHLLPMPFHIKSEQEDENYFYDTVNPGFWKNINGVPAHIPLNAEPSVHPQNLHPESQIYPQYTTHVNNATTSTLGPIDLYSRPQNYVQNYSISQNVARDNPQNLVVHRQYENNSPYNGDEFKRQDGLENVEKCDSKLEEPKENLKPHENGKLYYTEFSNLAMEKNENDSSEQNKIANDDVLSMNIKGEYICYKCNEIFPSKRGLKQHAKQCTENGENSEVPEKLGKFTCSQCPYRCQSPAILKIHERTHTGEKPFSCNFCDYKSGQKNNVAKHILVHMKEKPFRCQYCEYRCAQKNNLVVHERTHTGFKPFACPYCDYRTVQKPNLVKHMYLHTDQKPFSCDLCSYRCVQKTNLTKHKQRHLNEKEGDKIEVKTQTKPYRPRQKSVKCMHCPYRCVQKSSLDKHVLYKHTQDHQNYTEHFENGLNLMKNADMSSDVQNLSVKKDEQFLNETSEMCQEKLIVEPLQIQS